MARYSTVILGRTARNFGSLIPRTIIKCSGRLNGPYCLRWRTILSAIASPIPGSVASSSFDAVLMLMAFPGLLIGDSCATFCLDSLTQPGLSEICATITTVITAVRALAMGRLCFTYASECLRRATRLPLACALCWKSNIFRNFVCFMRRCPQTFPQLPWKMFQKHLGETSCTLSAIGFDRADNSRQLLFG